ncbi:putative hydro-lyase KRH_21160 [Pteropus medius]|uniref:putative hydro-lyase KRH_21160 n=1 Tax=Pteropus vampyrus TaxID=132908 RepID=UPI00196A560C|nr:putative hydro-lyase KRH_21160 [Pteropus giganteus]
MEEAPGPDNTHTVKALPPTSWHLTIVFRLLLFLPRFLAPRRGRSPVRGRVTRAALRARLRRACGCAERPGAPREPAPPPSRGRRSPAAGGTCRAAAPPSRTPAATQPAAAESCDWKRARERAGRGSAALRAGPAAPGAPATAGSSPQKAPRGLLPSLRFESICKCTTGLNSEAVGHRAGFLTELRRGRGSCPHTFLPPPLYGVVAGGSPSSPPGPQSRGPQRPGRRSWHHCPACSVQSFPPCNRSCFSSVPSPSRLLRTLTPAAPKATCTGRRAPPSRANCDTLPQTGMPRKATQGAGRAFLLCVQSTTCCRHISGPRKMFIE